MQTRTRFFIALVIAFIVLIAFALYEWSVGAASEPSAAAFIAASTTTTTASATSSAPASSTSASASASPYPPPSLGEQQGIVRIDGQTIYVDLDVTPAQQELGLGNRASLGAHQGMLFLFPRDQINMFWMKDMSFSIDMIWMADDGTIIYIQPNVAPSTYPDAFGPNEVSRYVLEVPANFAADNGIKVGDKATLP